jgi:hypothetical protein
MCNYSYKAKHFERTPLSLLHTWTKV